MIGLATLLLIGLGRVAEGSASNAAPIPFTPPWGLIVCSQLVAVPSVIIFFLFQKERVAGAHGKVSYAPLPTKCDIKDGVPVIPHASYLVSSAINYGRVSNAKNSLFELLGLARALGRRAIVPKLDACGADGVDSSFDSLFDTSMLSSEALSLGSFDFEGQCGRNSKTAIFVSIGGYPQFEGPPVGNTINFGGLTIPTVQARELAVNQTTSTLEKAAMDLALNDPLYANYFAPGVKKQLPEFLIEPLLINKLAERSETCLVLGRTYLGINWPLIPRIFEDLSRDVVPHSLVRKSVSEFLNRKGLVHCQFISIHLRMGDFLTNSDFNSFGAECNKNPSLLLEAIRLLLGLIRTEELCDSVHPLLVLSTDDYQSLCAQQLLRDFPHVIILQGESVFSPESCRKSLFDQEVLAHSTYFVADKKSTFSQAVHQIRSLRLGRNVSTTIWL